MSSTPQCLSKSLKDSFHSLKSIGIEVLNIESQEIDAKAADAMILALASGDEEHRDSVIARPPQVSKMQYWTSETKPTKVQSRKLFKKSCSLAMP